MGGLRLHLVGSHNVEKGSDSQGFMTTDVWEEISKKIQHKKKTMGSRKRYLRLP